MEWIKLWKHSDTSYTMVSGERITPSHGGLVDYPYRLYVTSNLLELFTAGMGNLIHSKKLSIPHPPLKQILNDAEHIILLHEL